MMIKSQRDLLGTNCLALWEKVGVRDCVWQADKKFTKKILWLLWDISNSQLNNFVNLSQREGKKNLGFTLMEMMIALAILASALSVLMGTLANTGQQSAYASDLTTATLLARSKMIDIEYEVMADEFSTNDQKYSGNFAAEGRPDMKWSATVTTVQIPEDAKEALLANVNSQLFGQKSEGLKGNAAFSSMLPTLIGKLPQMINQIGTKVRRVELKVEFVFGNGMAPVNVSQYIVDPNTKDFNVFGDLNAE